MAAVVLKRGDTLLLTCTFLTGGTAVDLTGYTILSQARKCGNGGLLADLTIVILNQVTSTGKFTVGQTAAQTALWAPGSYLMDIQYTDPLGFVRSTETVELEIVEDITR